jgi:hypothetical protein
MLGLQTKHVPSLAFSQMNKKKKFALWRLPCMHIILGSFTKWTKKNQNTHIPHNVKAFVDNNIMNDTGRTRRKKNEGNKILMMQAL